MKFRCTYSVPTSPKMSEGGAAAANQTIHLVTQVQLHDPPSCHDLLLPQQWPQP